MFPAGIISREQAEALLNEGEPGDFLVRVSERIFGYVLSYRSSEGIKHLLIDASENCYMLLGDQIRFSSLTELVEYHEVMYCTSLTGPGQTAYILASRIQNHFWILFIQVHTSRKNK